MQQRLLQPTSSQIVGVNPVPYQSIPGYLSTDPQLVNHGPVYIPQMTGALPYISSQTPFVPPTETSPQLVYQALQGTLQRPTDQGQASGLTAPSPLVTRSIESPLASPERE
jgi:hypothetical protein